MCTMPIISIKSIKYKVNCTSKLDLKRGYFQILLAKKRNPTVYSFDIWANSTIISLTPPKMKRKLTSMP